MPDWKPKTIRRFVKGFPSSARTALVETDVGPGYLKAMGGPEGPHTLASEVVVTQLASWFGLPTFEWSIIEVEEFDEIPFVDKRGKRSGRRRQVQPLSRGRNRGQLGLGQNEN